MSIYVGILRSIIGHIDKFLAWLARESNLIVLDLLLLLLKLTESANTLSAFQKEPQQ